jgi:hypothetical protein
MKKNEILEGFYNYNKESSMSIDEHFNINEIYSEHKLYSNISQMTFDIALKVNNSNFNSNISFSNNEPLDLGNKTHTNLTEMTSSNVDEENKVNQEGLDKIQSGGNDSNKWSEDKKELVKLVRVLKGYIKKTKSDVNVYLDEIKKEFNKYIDGQKKVILTSLSQVDVSLQERIYTDEEIEILVKRVQEIRKRSLTVVNDFTNIN